MGPVQLRRAWRGALLAYLLVSGSASAQRLNGGVSVRVNGGGEVRTVSPSSNPSCSGGTPLQFGVNKFDTTPSGPGYTTLLPPATGSGRIILTVNLGFYPVTVCPTGSEAINLFSGGTAYEQYPASMLAWVDDGVGHWDFPAQPPYAFPIYFFTAHAGGGQGSCTATGYGFNFFTTVASSGDSACLPDAFGGVEATLYYNGTTTPMDLFPKSGGTVNDQAINTQISIAAHTLVQCWDVGPPNEWVCK